MRLLQAMAGARHGGAEAFFVRLAIALHHAGQEQRVLIRADAERAAALRRGGVEVLELPFGGRLDLATRLGFRRAIARWRPDVVLTWMNRATMLCPGGDFVHVARLGGYYDLKYYRRCDHLIANTRDIAAYLAAGGWPQERIHYLPNFVSIAPAAPVPRASLGTPDGVPLALALGRLHPNKAFDLVLAAMVHAPEVHLWLAGEGELRASLEAQAAALGVAARVRFLGWREDTAALLAAADFLVSPARHEPLGNVLIEAWAAGVPVVATASEGPRALIADEETGLLVPVEDARALAVAMRRLAEDKALAARLAAAGRAAYDAEFSETRVVALYRDFVEKVAR
ncbi:MAG TPA: glycosyltransferase [Stellaceae bacterium]|jgi:glycosyltransferase involved in cell wall biosynthesis|nr:glycosyltransferase [Stellaceae bacterium]